MKIKKLALGLALVTSITSFGWVSDNDLVRKTEYRYNKAGDKSIEVTVRYDKANNKYNGELRIFKGRYLYEVATIKNGLASKAKFYVWEGDKRILQEEDWYEKSALLSKAKVYEVVDKKVVVGRIGYFKGGILYKEIRYNFFPELGFDKSITTYRNEAQDDYKTIYYNKGKVLNVVDTRRN